MTASRYVRAGGALGHLLLVAVLTLGIFAMHSTGHPNESPGPAMSTASQVSTMDTMDAAATAHDPVDAAVLMDTEHATAPADSPSAHQPAMAMDMASLCVAVLFGAWMLAALLKTAFARHREWLANLLAQVTVVLRPLPPPRGPDLAQLSVLRL